MKKRPPGKKAPNLPLPLARAWARMRRSIHPRRTEVVYSPKYNVRVGGTPIDPQRGEKILGFALSHGLLDERSSHVAGSASLKTLARVHTDRYLDELNQAGALLPVFGFAPDDEIRERALEAQRYAVDGTSKAVTIATRRNTIVFNLGGGFHHARADAGRGFCIFNDIAVAIRSHREAGFELPVLVLDLDLHDGDGTRAIFAEDPSVFTFSIHNRHWDDAAAEASESIELSNEVQDDEYLDVVRRRVPSLARAVRPGLVIYVAGTDPAHDDPLGNWRISEEGMTKRDQLVFTAIEDVLGHVPIVVTLAGGYGGGAWRYSATTLSWISTGRVIAPPSDEVATLERYRRIVSQLQASPLDSGSADLTEGAWSLSEEDIWSDLMGAKRSPRLLGFFSPHGVELTLERSGFLDCLRDLGFERPTIEFDLEDSAGDTVRIFGDDSRQDLLVEVRLRRDTRSAPGFDLLSIEWLLMQNPRLDFADPDRRLPGQSHPGLGLLNDMMALLIILCEELDIDGVSFVPSHYHLASKGRRFLHFLEPSDAAWYAALGEAVAELPMRRATLAVEGRRVVDDRGEVVAWRPMLMVLPVSERLRSRVEGDDYEAEVRAQREPLRFELAHRE